MIKVTHPKYHQMLHVHGPEEKGIHIKHDHSTYQNTIIYITENSLRTVGKLIFISQTYKLYVQGCTCISFCVLLCSMSMFQCV